MAMFDVFIDVLLTMRYRIDAASPDEAEALVEELAEKGVRGTVVEHEIASAPVAERSNDEEETNEEDTWGDW